MRVRLLLLIVLCSVVSGQSHAQSALKQTADTLRLPLTLKILPQDFYKQHLAFTCKKELQLQKLVSLPLYIRLGSKDYVDYLEKKPNAVMR